MGGAKLGGGWTEVGTGAADMDPQKSSSSPDAKEAERVPRGGVATCNGASTDAVVGVGASAGVRRPGMGAGRGVCLIAVEDATTFAGTLGGDGDRRIGLSVS